MKSRQYRTIFNSIRTSYENGVSSLKSFFLLRCLSLIFSLYYALTSILLAYEGHYYLSIIVLFSITAMAGCFLATFENKNYLSLRIFQTTITTTSICLSIFIGWDYSFHLFLIMVILLTIFSFSITSSNKKWELLILTLLFLMIRVFPSPILFSDSKRFLFTTIFSITNALFALLGIIFISVYFTMKFHSFVVSYEQNSKKLKTAYSIDPLTNLLNRSAMQEHFTELTHRYSMQGESFSVAIISIDSFQSFNSMYGLSFGDLLIKEFSSLLTKRFPNNTLARWNGTEFMITFEKITFASSQVALNDFCNYLNNYTFYITDTPIHVTISGGITEYIDFQGIDATIILAHQKLLLAKQNGKNQITC